MASVSHPILCAKIKLGRDFPMMQPSPYKEGAGAAPEFQAGAGVWTPRTGERGRRSPTL